jgi:hypothetical protein
MFGVSGVLFRHEIRLRVYRFKRSVKRISGFERVSKEINRDVRAYVSQMTH